MRLVSVLGWSLVALACAPASQADSPAAPTSLSAEDVAAIHAVDAAFAAGMNAKDTNAIVALYTEDAKFLPPDSPILEGPAIRAYLSGMMAGVSDFALMPLTTQGTGTLAYTVGTATFSIGGTATTGKYVEVLRKEADGKWRMAVDIFNSAAPSPTAATR